MASLKLEHIYKVYPNGTKAVNDFTMDIQDGEFIVFVGPSGCGKSTTLRMIAGLEDITAGELYINNNIVNSVEPKDRDVAMFFQNYALYPHMTIYENMAFGLKLRHVKNDIIHQKVLWAAEVLGIKEYLDRKPKAMSGGQRQRVALGRAILRDPKVMLLDEPLSNLDAKLRTQMRSEIAKLHQNLKTTFIYVTHDQTEAMTLGTRVVVMKLGRIQQIDTPKNLYNYPVNKFVAGFIGTPQMNFFQGTLQREKDIVNINFSWSDAKISVPYSDMLKVRPSYLDGKHQVYIGIRCENVTLAQPGETTNVVKVKVSHFEELGSETLLYGDINMEGDGFEETATRVIMKVAEMGDIKIGDVIEAKFDMSKAHFFDVETEMSILPRVPTENAFDCTVEKNTLKFLDIEAKLPPAISADKVGEATMIVPNEAILLGSGPYEAVVEKTETVDNIHLCYLSRAGRTFFTTTEGTEKVGSKVKFDLDFTKIRVYRTENGEDISVIEPLAKMDSFTAEFYNYDTVMAHHPNDAFVAERNDRIEKTRAKNVELRAAKLKEKEEQLAKYQGSSLDELRQKAAQELAEVTKINNEKIAALKAEAQKVLSALKADHKGKVAEIKQNNKKLFADRKKEENETFKHFKAENKDPLALRRRKEEHRIYKETSPGEKEQDLNNALNNEALVYETERSQIQSELRRNVGNLKSEIKEKKQNCAFLNNPQKKIEKDYNVAIAQIDKEEKNELRRASLMFFFGINGYYFETGDAIAGKLIQGLGTRVFGKSFLIEVPHDAYIVGADGIEAEVVENLDYGNLIYVRCQCVGHDGKDCDIYIKSAEPMEKGTKIKVSPDIVKTQITETSMNIRLY